MAIVNVVRDVFDKLLMRELRVVEVRALGATFHRIELEGEGLRTASIAPGDKVQIMFGVTARTYTPFDVDAARGRMSLLVHLHGEGPGARWGARAAVGQSVYVFGPRGSLDLERVRGKAVFFGDETSFAVARCLAQCAAEVRCVFEVERPEEARVVLAELGVPADALVQKSRGARQHHEAVSRLGSALSAWPGAHLVMTGEGPAIQAVRKGLKEILPAGRKQLVKAYWAPGKRGLD